MYHKSYDYIEYYDKDTGQKLKPDFYSMGHLPEYGDVLSFNGGITYRIDSVHEDFTIREIKEHGGSDVDEYAIVTVKRIGEVVSTQDFRLAVNHEEGTCSIIKYIGSNAVVVIPCEIGAKPVVAINADAFKGNATISSITIPISVRELKEESFANCTRLKEVTLQSGLEEIPHDLFDGCVALEKVNIPETVKRIAANAFTNCKSLKSIHLPASLEEISGATIWHLFDGCDSLTTITVDEQNKVFDSRDNCNAIIETATNKLLVGCKGTVIPESVSDINRYKSGIPESAFATYYKKRECSAWMTGYNGAIRMNTGGAGGNYILFLSILDGKMGLREHKWNWLTGKHRYCEVSGVDIVSFLSYEDIYDVKSVDDFASMMKHHFEVAWYQRYNSLDALCSYLEKKRIEYSRADKESDKLLLYFHGFGSSGEGSTVKTLRELLPDWIVLAPDIPIDPTTALPFLKELSTNLRPEVIVGTSMGGMYAAMMSQNACRHIVLNEHMGQEWGVYKRICINPAFYLSKVTEDAGKKTLLSWLFKKSGQHLLKEGTYEFLNPRRDGEKTFTITPEIIQHFVDMEAQQFDDITKEDKENVYGLFADNDTTVNCEDIFMQHYKNVVHFHGEHRLSRQAIEEVIVPLIKEKTNK